MASSVTTSPAPALVARTAGWGQVSVLHVVIILLSLIMTITVWKYSENQIAARTKARFESARDATLGLLKSGMKKYEDGLWAGVSAMQSHGNEMSSAQWAVFAQTLRIDEKYPGINGIGYIEFVNPADLPAFLKVQRLLRPQFDIYPDQVLNAPDLLMPITFIEPVASNAQAVGLDVSHEINRRTAAFASRDTGTAQITGPITLVQANNPDTPGFLFYVPLYSTQNPGTPAERQEQATGLIYAPFVVYKLMEGLLAKDLRTLRFSITDGTQVIYDEHADQDPTTDPDPMYQETVTLDLYGRDWTIDMRTNLAFRASNTYAQPTFLLIGGLIIEALIIALLVMMSRATKAAQAYAARVTAALRAEKQKLAHTNEELEQFAYVASHDLKTPIRGIRGLTDMLREDLEDYLRSPDALPEVGQNLDRIDARVARMTELTRGILEFSRVGSINQSGPPLEIADATQTMAADFGIAASQISLDTDVEDIAVDGFNCRRVLENLVGNAIKFHKGPDPLQIKIRVRRIPERLQFEVSDNGPGIDPKFHHRIFEVFQTLREADAPESTGIGLAIVKKLVERQGGAIILTSAVGKGATFKFDWPARNRATTDKSKLEKAA